MGSSGKVLILLFGTLVFFTTPARSQIRTCGMQQVLGEQLQDPKYRERYEKLRRQAFEAGQLTRARALCANPIVIPVAVHFQNISNPDQPCLVSLAQDQIQIINDDFQGQNVDISNWVNTDSPQFPSVNYGETCVEFCLASFNHPTGYGLTEGQPAVTINTTSGDSDSNWSGYLNIWVRNIGPLGYSPLGGNGNGDGVTVDNSAFGSGSGCNGVSPGSPYDLGRTLTHELGHYFNLGHIWGGGCGSDDGISDTPNSQGPYYGCPSGYPSTCGSTDMHMNYMDYVNDACMYMFSSGQSSVMETYFNGNLQNLINNASTVCAAPTCSDGIQNGSETGVDCGGPDCPACPPPTCTDGIQNGNETGVDCGGPDCPACPPCVNLTLTLNFDNYPEETSWDIQDSGNNVVASGGTYGSQADGSTLNINECLPPACYTLTIYDSYGDGMCCGYGNGSYDLVSCGASLASGGNFNSSESTTICFYNEYIFQGTTSDSWNIDANWHTGVRPPTDYNCTIRISADCNKSSATSVKGDLIIDSGVTLTQD